MGLDGNNYNYIANLSLAHQSAMQNIYRQEKENELVITSTGTVVPRGNILYCQRRGTEKLRVYFKTIPDGMYPFIELNAPDLFEFWEKYTGEILPDDNRPGMQEYLENIKQPWLPKKVHP